MLRTFVTIFLGIFIEATPFLLAGSLVSGLVEVFVNPETLQRLVPRSPVLAALAGALLGLTFPVCECGVVPVTRRLYQKGLPPSAGVAFLLAAPVINPVVIASTYVAFGWGTMLWGRVGMSLLVAFAVGLLFQAARPEEILLPQAGQKACCSHETLAPSLEHGPESAPAGADEPGGKPSPARSPSRGERFQRALITAGDDFLDMARYLVIGSFLAATMQTVVPQSALLAIGGGAATSVLGMLAMAFVLSVCSTVDAFLALAFVNTFAPGAILGFLVFGPMVDVKSLLMFLGVFRPRAALYLVLLPMMMVAPIAIAINLSVR